MIVIPNLKDIRTAYTRIALIINKTPVMTSRTLNSQVGIRAYFKCENFQRAGAFKFRGAYNSILQLSKDEKEKGIIAHSSGNHAQAVSLASNLLGVKVIIVMPKYAPKVKIEATRGYGAKIIFSANTLIDRVKITRRLVSKHGYKEIHPYDNKNVIIGAGTAALEFMDEIEGINLLYCPVGGGGFISGTSIAAKGLNSNCQVIGVEPEIADDAYRSFKTGKLFENLNLNTIADGLRTSLSDLTFSIIRKHVDDIITVSEMDILNAMRFLWERMKMVVEPSGAVSLAGVLSRKIEMKNKRVGIMISGGNVSLEQFFALLSSKITE